MRPRIRLLDRPRATPALGLAGLVLLLGAPREATAQFQDARRPEPGRLWFEITPVLENWSDQFALDSPDPDVADGEREPLFRDFDGPVASRLFPGPDAFLAEVNGDAAALGFAPLSASELSFGGLDFGTISAQRRRIELGIELGILDRVSFEARAPLVFSEVETSFRYDSASATVFAASTAFSTGSSFFTDFQMALADLQALIDGGTLDPAGQAAAIALRDGSDAFLAALSGRVAEAGFLPIAPSRAGLEMTSHVDSLAAEFESFGLVLPDFALPDVATSESLGLLFGPPPVAGSLPVSSEEAWSIGEVELGLRIGLLDQISRPGRARTEGGSGAGGSGHGGVRFRTTIGGKLRLPARTGLRPTAESPADFVGLPRGDAQRDVEVALYQDVAIGGSLILNAAARYGVQLEDELRLRVRPPDRPFAFASSLAAVRRDLGDYLQLRVAPRLRLNAALSLGLEYDLWRKGSDRYELLEQPGGVADAAALELETEMTRQRIGLGLFYDLSEAEGREEIARRRARNAAGREPEAEEGAGAKARADAGELAAEAEEARREGAGDEEGPPEADAGPAGEAGPSGGGAGEPDGIVRPPWRFALTVQRAIAGSGGQTPASLLVAFGIRAPIRIF